VADPQRIAETEDAVEADGKKEGKKERKEEGRKKTPAARRRIRLLPAC
jgi:hypothetical protein